MLAEYIQYKYIYPTDTCFPTQRPKGAQTPSNCNISPKCWQKISNTNISIQLTHLEYLCVPFAKDDGAKLSVLHCGAKLSWCQIVLFSLWCQIVPFTLRCQIVLFSWRCQIVPFSLRCQIVLGAKLSSFTLLVPNCPGAKLSSVPNCPRCQIVLGAKLSPNQFVYLINLSAKNIFHLKFLILYLSMN